MTTHSIMAMAYQDFLTIDPRFASDSVAARANPQLAEKELRRLVDEAHARGLYVILDVVLNHAGNVFGYDLGPGQNNEAMADFRDRMRRVRWHDEDGGAAWRISVKTPENLSSDAAIWPRELHSNDFFRRKGKGGESGGDFNTLKEFVTDGARVREILMHLSVPRSPNSTSTAFVSTRSSTWSGISRAFSVTQCASMLSREKKVYIRGSLRR